MEESMQNRGRGVWLRAVNLKVATIGQGPRANGGGPVGHDLKHYGEVLRD